VCPAPRGLAWDERTGNTWVTCASGGLTRVGASGAVATTWLDPDLRDIVIVGDEALIARVRAAEVLVVDLDTQRMTARLRPPAPTGAEGFTPRVARRLVAWQDRAVLAYQLHQDDPVVVDDTESSGAYTGHPSVGGVVPPDDCQGIVRAALAVVGPDGFGGSTILAGGPPVDVLARGADFPSASDVTDGTGVTRDPEPDSACAGKRRFPEAPIDGVDALVRGAEEWAVSRDGGAVPVETLTGDRSAMPSAWELQTGMFEAVLGGLSCAACHPDGADDGHTWRFTSEPRPTDPGALSAWIAASDARRTQPLGGGVLDSAPFHWRGDQSSIEALYLTVGVRRMGLPMLSGMLLDDLEAWVDGVAPLPPVGPPPDPDLVARGVEVFWAPAVGCARCHNGARFSNGSSADVGTGEVLQVPTLLGVGARSPLMHDGCAATLYDRLTDPLCGGGDRHGVTSVLSPDDLDALVAFLRTL
jgi:hypothetical protein